MKIKLPFHRSEPKSTPLPTGTVTFLFTDIQGSTKLWETQPEAMRTALARHDALLRLSIGQHRWSYLQDRRGRVLRRLWHCARRPGGCA